MLNDIEIELGLLFGVFTCVFIFVPTLMRPPSINPIGVLPLFAFIGLLIYSGYHTKKLIGNGKTTHSILFLIILVTSVFVSSILIWDAFPPMNV